LVLSARSGHSRIYRLCAHFLETFRRDGKLLLKKGDLRRRFGELAGGFLVQHPFNRDLLAIGSGLH
jgi:hypothetical protein